MRLLRYRPAHRASARSRIWTVFVFAMLLASLIPATAPAAAQGDDQTQDQTQEQTGDQTQTDDPNAQPTEDPNAIPTEDPNEQPTEDMQNLTNQDQQDQPQVENGSIAVSYRVCPPGTDLSSMVNPQALSGTCTGGENGVPFSLSGVNGQIGSGSTGDAGQSAVAFADVAPGQVTLTRVSDPVAGMAVFCQGNTSHGNTKPYAQAALAPVQSWFGINLEVLEGEQIQCDWYVAPQPAAENSVTVYKWDCEPGTQYRPELEYYQGGLADQETGPCETEHLNIPITLTDGNGDHPTTTQANGTQWDNVVPNQQGQIVIAETIPTGYGDPVVFCGLLTQDTQTQVTPTTGGRIALTPPANTQFDYQCNWYNIPLPDNSVTVYKWDCQPETEYGRELEYYQGGLPSQETGPCETEHLNIPITLTDANGPHATTTQANGTQWDNVVPDAQVSFTIAEEIPTGYGDPMVFCGTLDQETQTPVTATGGRITLTPTTQPFDYQCNWYNLPGGYGSVTVYKWDCEPGTQYRPELEYYQGGLPDQETGPCETEHLNIPITLIDGNGEHPTTTQANGTEWDDVVRDQQGQIRITEQIPDGYGDPVVFCGTLDEEQQTRMTSTGGSIILAPTSSDFTYQCNWYNIPYLDSSVTIRKWECPQGMTIENTAEAHQSACTQPMNGVEFTLTDGKGPRAQSTTGGQVAWTDVTTGPLTITETIPSGYSPNPYVVCGWTAYYNGAVVDAFPQPVATINGVLNTSIMYPGTTFFCDWYNSYAGPGEVTIYKWTCPEGYDPYAWNAEPKSDCTQATNGVTFVLDQPEDVDLQTTTGDSINGAVYFGGLTPGDYTVNEIVPSNTQLVFVWDCVGITYSSVHPVPLSVGPTLNLKIAGGDKIACDWYNVPAHNPQYGWMTVTKYACSTATYVKDVDCEVYEQGQQFTLQAWNGSAWADVATGTTNGAGQLTWTNLNAGTYRVTEPGKTPCAVKSDKMSADNNLAVQANAGTNVKVYNCGVLPPAGGKTPTKYPNTGVGPTGSGTQMPFGALFGAIGTAGAGATTMSRRAFLRRAAGAAAVVGGGTLAVTTVLANQPIVPIQPLEGTPEGTPSGTPAADCLFPATPAATPDGVHPGTPVACARGAVPVHLRIETIGVDANVEILEIVQGEMQQPTGAEDVAWYKETARLGERGNVLIAGHLNFWGVPEGVFFKLETLREGDRVEIEGDNGEVYRYVVQWTQDFPSDQEPPEEALGQLADQEALTMITCGGEWVTDRAEYDHRTLVRAVRDTGVAPEGTPASTPQV